jgi:3-hydroxyacyl-[acyl-carrier-protein] dehydratase
MTPILLDHFYKIDHAQNAESNISAQITFDRAHLIFAGHFPDMPIVPGVCQTQMLGEVLGQVLHADLQLKSAATIRFLSVVDPRETPSLLLDINYTRHGMEYAVNAQYKWNETVFFKFKGIFAVA